MKQFNRKSPRATWHKYNGGEYFITICTKNRIHYFGEIVDGETQLTPIGGFLKSQLENTQTIQKGDVEIPIYVIMPDHVHFIVIINDLAKINKLGFLIRGIKSSVTKYSYQNALPFEWQSRYYDRIIRNQNEMNRIVENIINNPINWGK